MQGWSGTAAEATAAAAVTAAVCVPVAAPLLASGGPGVQAAVAAAIGQVGGVGGNLLAEVIVRTHDRIRRSGRPADDADLLRRELERELLVAYRQNADLLADSWALLRSTGERLEDLLVETQRTRERVDLVLLEVRRQRVADSRDEAPPGEAPADRAGDRRPADLPCPYPGLAACDLSHPSSFQGRDDVTADLVARLAAARPGAPDVTFVVGVSGAGKSSLLRAGLVPALADGVVGRRRRVVLMTPGPDPARDLAAALAHVDVVDLTESPDRRPVLVVDQFERLYQCGDAGVRESFVDSVVRLSRSVGVVLSLRADFYARCAADSRLSPHLAAGVLVGALDDAGLRAAIELPARELGVTVEPALVERLLRDLGAPVYEPGRLPLLAHALRETWLRSEGRTIGVRDYEATGGIDQAVARTAQEAYEDLDDAGRAAARRLFRRLVTLGDDTADVRRRAPLAEVTEVVADDVLHAFVSRRLLTPDEDAVEITHDALLRAWPTLRDWLDDDREGRRTHERLIRSAREWDDARRDPSHLYRGLSLDLALSWAAPNAAELSPPEREFLRAGWEARTAVAVADRRRARTMDLLKVGIAGLVWFCLTATVLVVQTQARATERQEVALSLHLAAESSEARESDPELAAGLAVLAYRQSPTPQALSGLRAAATDAAVAELRHPAAVRSVAWSPDGNPVTAAGDGHWRSWDPRTGDASWDPARPPPSRALSLSPDGSHLAYADDASVRVLDIGTGKRQPMADVFGSGRYVKATFWSPDGKLVAAADSVRVAVWEAGSGRLRSTLTTGGYPDIILAQDLAFSPDSRSVVTAEGVAGSPARWSLDTAQARRVQVETLPPERRVSATSVVAWHPSAELVALGDDDGHVGFWSPAVEKTAEPAGDIHTSVTALAWSPDGTTLALGGADGTIHLWSREGRPRSVLRGHEAAVRDIAWSAGGALLASGDDAGTARVWNLLDDGPWLHLPPQAVGPGTAVAWSDDGRQLYAGDVATGSLALVAGSPPANVRQTAAAPGRDETGGAWRLSAAPAFRVSVDEHDPPVVAWRPDGRMVAVGDPDGSLSLQPFEVDNVTRPVLLRGRSDDDAYDPVTAVAWRPDGGSLAYGTRNSALVVRDLATGRERRLPDSNGLTDVVAWRPDGELLAAGSHADRRVRVWNARTGDVVATLGGADPAPESSDDEANDTRRSAVDGVPAAGALAWHPNGTSLAVGGADGGLRVWDVTDGSVGLRYAAAGQDGPVEAIAWRPSGTGLATATDDGVQVWEVPSPGPAAAISAVCREWPPSLTGEQWDAYAPGAGLGSPCPLAR